MNAKPALIGKAGEVLVAAELLRRGLAVAYPASDVGIDLLAYNDDDSACRTFVPIQVKARAKTGYHFQKDWFGKNQDIALIHVWHVATSPEFYVFSTLDQVLEALGQHAFSPSWITDGRYSVTNPSSEQLRRMQPHRNEWGRIGVPGRVPAFAP